MNEVTIKGEVKFVDEVREYGANGFRKQEVVVETGDGKWDNPIAVEFTKDNIEKSQTLKKGDRVTIYLPMVPELPISMLACARIGAAHSVVFGGFSAESLRDRLNDSESKIMITADGGYRRGRCVV